MGEKIFWMLMGAVGLFIVEVIVCAWSEYRQNQAMQRAIERDIWRS